MEQGSRDTVGRSQNVVHVVPQDWQDVSRILGGMLERIDAADGGPQVLVITPDAETAAAAAESILHSDAATHPRAIAATSAPRAARVLKAGGVHVVAGAPRELLELMQGAQLKLDRLRGVALAWLEGLNEEDAAALATIMGEVPKDAARTIATTAATPEIEQLIERYARRAPRVVAPAPPGLPPVELSYVTTAASARGATLRRLLDHLDPPTATIVARHPRSLETAEAVLHAAGAYGAAAPARVARRADGTETLVVLYDLPDSRATLHEWTGGVSRVVALVQPRQLESLRQLAGGPVQPITLPEAGQRARQRDERLRSELRAILDGGTLRDTAALEPLLEEYDGVEIAAAALTLLERARAQRTDTPEAARRAPAAMTRLFVSVGGRDNVRPGDLVGAIANEASISSAQVGKIEVRDSHSLVEVASDVAERVATALSGVMIRGRRVVARPDKERPARPTEPRGRSAVPRGPRKTTQGRPTRRRDEE